MSYPFLCVILPYLESIRVFLNYDFYVSPLQKGVAGDKVIRRNSLTTLHPLPRVEVEPSPLGVERQRTVPHGFNVCFIFCLSSSDDK